MIDCQTDNLEDAVAFWTGALGGSARVDADGQYALIEDGPDGIVLLQAVEHAPRVHLDIESDDQAAEVKRLVGLGAEVIAQIKGWTVMQAPTGHRFCVVNPQSDDFADGARLWSDLPAE